MLRSARPLHLVRTLATSANVQVTRHTWAKQEIQQIYDTPLLDLVFRAAAVHREHHDPSKVQLCTLMNIKSMSITSYALALTDHMVLRSWWLYRRL
jgi:biotin synthase